MKEFLYIFGMVLALEMANAQSSPYGLGVLTVLENQQDSIAEQNFCIKFYPQLYNLTTNKTEATIYDFDQLIFLKDADTCDADDPAIPTNLTGKFSIIPTGNSSSNCSLFDRAQIIKNRGAIGLLADRPLSSRFNITDEDFEAKMMAVAALYRETDKAIILNMMKTKGQFILYSPPEIAKAFDFSLLLILFMAVFTVAVGSMWSGFTKQTLIDIQKNQDKANESINNEQEQPGGANHNPEHHDEQGTIYESENKTENRVAEEVSLRVTPWLVLGFVSAMCLLLILLYFFFDQLVYVIIGMFCLASFTALYSCFEPIVFWSYKVFPNCKTIMLPQIRCCGCTVRMEIRQFLLVVICLAITITWVIYRKSSWAWMLQDFLGVMFSLNMLKTLRLPSLKIITILLCTLFIYDIFFVFVTPYLTKDGKSVMVEVATGGNTDEQLPMVLKVPHMNNHPMTACYDSYSMLGFGDILVPGLLVSFCHSYDLKKANGIWVYWAITNFFYFSGMVATFVSLFVMNSAQPALLYLVPFTLIPVFIVAAICGDLGAMWNGDVIVDENDDHEEDFDEDDDDVSELSSSFSKSDSQDN